MTTGTLIEMSSAFSLHFVLECNLQINYNHNMSPLYLLISCPLRCTFRKSSSDHKAPTAKRGKCACSSRTIASAQPYLKECKQTLA